MRALFSLGIVASLSCLAFGVAVFATSLGTSDLSKIRPKPRPAILVLVPNKDTPRPQYRGARTAVFQILQKDLKDG